MSTLKISDDLFLGKIELERLFEFLQNQAPFDSLCSSFGLVRSRVGASFENFRVVPGTLDGTISIPVNSYAVDKNRNLIFVPLTDNIPIPNNSNWYWVKIKYQTSTQEPGVVSINTQGILTGVGTSFLPTLRPQPDYPTKLKFLNASLNVGEYEVISVTDNTTALLAGDFQSESNLRYAHVGTFTPGHIPSPGDKQPFRFDSCIPLTIGEGLILETVSNTPPTLIPGEEFLLARVRNVSNVIEIQDQRTEFFSPIENITPLPINPLLGVEKVQWKPVLTSNTQEESLVTIGWGFRSHNFTLNPTSNTVTLLGGEGGRFKDTSHFTNGDFDGWVLYSPNGTRSRVLTSNKSGLQINLVLDRLVPSEFSNSVDVFDPIVIVPDVEKVQFRCSPGMDEWSSRQPSKVFEFEAREGFGLLELHMYSNLEVSYNIVFRHGSDKDWSQWGFFEADSVGFLRENSFTPLGALKPLIDRVRLPYSKVENDYDGWLFLQPNPDSYSNFKQRVDTNTKPGTELRLFDVAVNLHNLEVGVDPKLVILESKVGDTLLTQNIFINLGVDNVVDGSEFLVWLRGGNSLFPLQNGFNIRFVQDYVDSVTYTPLRTLTFRDVELLRSQIGVPSSGIMYQCTYRSSTSMWEIKQLGEINQNPWNNITLATNYVNLGPPWHLFQARIDSYNNRVFLRGAIQNSVSSPLGNIVVATLPLGYRPVRRLRTWCVIEAGGNPTVKPIEIDSSGTITVIGGHDGTLPIDFTGVNFDLDS